MKASKLVEILQEELLVHDDFEVLISTNDGELEGFNFTSIIGVGWGIDWERGQFLIHAKDRLMTKGE